MKLISVSSEKIHSVHDLESKLKLISFSAKNLDHELKQVEERSRLNTRRNTRRISRVLGMGGAGGIPLKALVEAAKENNNNGGRCSYVNL